MMQIDTDSLVDLRLTLNWQDSEATHVEVYDASKVNFWRDILPRTLYHKLIGKGPGDSVELSIETGTSLVGYNQRGLFTIDKSQFVLSSDAVSEIPARIGRFYPKGVLRDIAGVYPQNQEPFRCVGIENSHIMVDFNHPLVERQLNLNADVLKVIPKAHERGGSSADWIEVLANGPGMQGRWRRLPTDFFSENAFDRVDTASDSAFYIKPRLVYHMDVTARQIITQLYEKLLSNQLKVLDLMSSWVSHLPDHFHFDQVVGLGLNREELAQNLSLDKTVVHDLNLDTRLPFESESFDAVICTASIEYLIDPVGVYKEVARVLTPGGIFIVTFSNRWFPPKAINIWPQLHEFERMGLVTEYFLQSEKFHNLHTFSRRGLPRDMEDKYYDKIPYADPVYAVWGFKK